MQEQTLTLEEQIDFKGRKDKLMAMVVEACRETELEIVPCLAFDKFKGVSPSFEIVSVKKPAVTALAPTATTGKKIKNGKDTK